MPIRGDRDRLELRARRQTYPAKPCTRTEPTARPAAAVAPPSGRPGAFPAPLRGSGGCRRRDGRCPTASRAGPRCRARCAGALVFHLPPTLTPQACFRHSQRSEFAGLIEPLDRRCRSRPGVPAPVVEFVGHRCQAIPLAPAWTPPSGPDRPARPDLVDPARISAASGTAGHSESSTAARAPPHARDARRAMLQYLSGSAHVSDARPAARAATRSGSMPGSLAALCGTLKAGNAPRIGVGAALPGSTTVAGDLKHPLQISDPADLVDLPFDQATRLAG